MADSVDRNLSEIQAVSILAASQAISQLKG